jgi:uncharacterized membrane protein
VGDLGVHERCGPSFWKEVTAAMVPDLHARRYTEALCRGVERAGEVLAAAFPREPGRTDVNELPDAVSRD